MGSKTKRILVGYKIKFFLRPILNNSQISGEGSVSSRTYPKLYSGSVHTLGTIVHVTVTVAAHILSASFGKVADNSKT